MSNFGALKKNQLERKLREYQHVSQDQQKKISELVKVIEKMSIKSRGDVLYECPDCGAYCDDLGNIYNPNLQCPECKREFSRIGYRPAVTIYRKRD